MQQNSSISPNGRFYSTLIHS